MPSSDERRIVELVLKAVGDTEVQRMTAELLKLRRSAEDSAGALKYLEEAGKHLGEQFKEIGAKIVAGFALEGIIDRFKEAAESMEQLALATQKVGVSAKDLQGLNIAANLTGTNVETLDKGLQILSKNMADLAGKGGPATKYLRDLGITAKTDVYEAFTKLSEQFEKMPDGAQKTALAMLEFGKAGAQLIPMLNESAKLLVEIAEVSENWGTKLTDKDVDAVAQLTDHIKVLNSQVGLLTDKFVSGLAPALDAIAKQLMKAKVNGSAFFEIAGWIGARIIEITAGFEIFWSMIVQVDHALYGLGGEFLFVGKSIVDLMTGRFEALDADLKAISTQARATWLQMGADSKKGYADALALRAGYLANLAAQPEPKPKGDGDVPDLGKAAKAKKVKTPVDKTGEEYLKRLTDELKRYETVLGDAEKKTLDMADAQQKLVDGFNEAADPTAKFLKDMLDISKARDTGKLTAQGEALAMQKARDAYDAASTALYENSDAHKAAVQAADLHKAALDKLQAKWGFVADAMGQATQKMIDGSESVGTAMREMVANVISELTRMALVAAANKIFGAILKSAGLDPFKAAQGAAFVGGVKAFASGGILSGPTAFGMAGGGIGIAGEAGAEAVAPLRRDASGNLGVVAPRPHVTVNNYAGADVAVRPTDQGLQIDVMRRQLADDIRRGGNPLSAALEGTYRVGRYAGAYT
jgi:hypothetical protein